jgi:hypothetical protein
VRNWSCERRHAAEERGRERFEAIFDRGRGPLTWHARVMALLLLSHTPLCSVSPPLFLPLSNYDAYYRMKPRPNTGFSFFLYFLLFTSLVA